MLLLAKKIWVERAMLATPSVRKAISADWSGASIGGGAELSSWFEILD